MKEYFYACGKMGKSALWVAVPVVILASYGAVLPLPSVIIVLVFDMIGTYYYSLKEYNR